MGCLDVHKAGYRFARLFFNCLLTFGSYFCFDMPSVLQDQMQGNYYCNGSSSENESLDSIKNDSCCPDCLGMTFYEYNLLYAVYSWTNAIVVIGAGFLIDKLGNRVGVFLFSSLCVVGSSVFAIGAMLKGNAVLLPLMLIGRLLFGAGNGSLTIVQNRITAIWFTGKELALAFGITLAFSRFGSVMNFFLTSHINNAVGIVWTLWIGTLLCAVGFLSAIVVSFLDVVGMKRLGQNEKIDIQSKKVRVTDMKHFSISFWLLALTIMFFSNGIFPFIADASKFFQDKYGYDHYTAGYMAGAVYDVLMVLSPFLGGIIDIFGKRGIFAVSCSILTIPVFGLLAFSTVHPLLSTLWLGITYSVAAASMRPSIPLVVAQATVGTAMGLTTSIQMIGTGVSNLIVGKLLGKGEKLQADDVLKRWKYVMIYFLANTLACVVTSLLLNVYDRTKGGVLNMNKEKIKQMLVDQEAEEVPESQSQDSKAVDTSDSKFLVSSTKPVN